MFIRTRGRHRLVRPSLMSMIGAALIGLVTVPSLPLS